LPVDVFEAELRRRPRPDVVLVTSMMTYWYPGPFEAIRRVKAHWPGVPVALGGVYATLCSEHARAHSGADVVFAGSDNDRVRTWIEQVAGDRPTPLSTNRLLPTLANNRACFPAHDLRRRQGFVAVLTARGCPFHCPYCAVHQLSPSPFAPRPPIQVVDEIAWCVESLGAQDVVFYDDALLFDAQHHIHPLLDEVIARHLQVRFHTPNGLHARFIDRPLAHKMRRAGFVTIRLGLESADPAQQQHDGSKIDRTQFSDAVEALFAAGFSACDVAAYVLIARPGQDLASVRETAAFAHRLGIQVIPAQYTPIPGTTEWQDAIAAGCIVADADPLLHNNSIYPCAELPPWEALKQQIREHNRFLSLRTQVSAATRTGGGNPPECR
jgi:radical SAM superfamily enzyme YgiQ (UPF0313 family)